MPQVHKHTRYEIRGARVAWEPWTFWHLLKGKRIAPNVRRHEVRNIGADGLDFTTREPPNQGSQILMNLFLPDEALPHMARGYVSRVKTHEGGHNARVRVKFSGCPESLASRIEELGDTII